jgi:cell division protein FtsB
MTLKRHSHTTVIFDRIKIALLFVLVCVVAISTTKMIATYLRAKKSIREGVRAQEVLKEKEQKLTSDIELTKTDFGQETLLREKYGFAKEGENVVFVIPENKITQVDASVSFKESQKTSLLRDKWQALKDALFGK